MGAWIETIQMRDPTTQSLVAPYVGAWIETQGFVNNCKAIKSHPMWVRGLKQ